MIQSSCQWCSNRLPKTQLIQFLLRTCSSEKAVHSEGASSVICEFDEDPDLVCILPADWNSYRTGFRLNPSSVKSVITFDIFKNPYDLAVEKACQIVNQKRGFQKYVCNGVPLVDADPVFHEKYKKSSVHITRGVNGEKDAKTMFERVSGHRLIPMHSQTMFHRKSLFGGQMGATPDGITYCGTLFEAKCPVKLSMSKVNTYNEQVQSMLHTLQMEECILFQYDVVTRNTLSCVIVRDMYWVKENESNIRVHVDFIEALIPTLLHPLFKRDCVVNMLQPSSSLLSISSNSSSSDCGESNNGFHKSHSRLENEIHLSKK